MAKGLEKARAERYSCNDGCAINCGRKNIYDDFSRTFRLMKGSESEGTFGMGEKRHGFGDSRSSG